LNFYEKIFEFSGKNFAAPSSGVLDYEKNLLISNFASCDFTSFFIDAM